MGAGAPTRSWICCATARHRKSVNRSPITCTPTGSPSAVPHGTIAAGIARKLAGSTGRNVDRISVSVWCRSASCSNAGCPHVGLITTGWSTKNRLQSRIRRKRLACTSADSSTLGVGAPAWNESRMSLPSSPITMSSS